MLEVVLYQPEIPHNTGAIMRLCASTNSRLHLIEPLGFSLSNKYLKRSGMDYRNRVNMQFYPSLENMLDVVVRSKTNQPQVFAFTTKAKTFYFNAKLNQADVLIFGPETRGLPLEFLDKLNNDRKLRIPMIKGERSLNLAMSVGIVVYEAIRQNQINLKNIV